MGCSSLATNTPNYILIEENYLSGELKETSGLYCPEVGSAYTVNDSGNKPIIYHIDSKGRIIDTIPISSENKDWEALTGDGQNFYVGDVGNNNGKREFVQIHIVPKTVPKIAQHSEKKVITSELFYKNNSIKNNEYLDHDFDAEALVSVDDHLFLFSKSWHTGTLFVYKINKAEPKQFIEHVSEIEGLPGVVTGGDFDRTNNRFILVGYELKSFGRFYPFITILNKDFSLQKSYKLAEYGQVEGVCVTPNGDIWFTQEGSFLSHNKMVKLNIMK
ncbi:MAG: hypothetical protein JKY14_00095 [Paraglaciecola sp.]|nr:hypothetical protein [Paraglaciecola sp.]